MVNKYFAQKVKIKFYKNKYRHLKYKGLLYNMQYNIPNKEVYILLLYKNKSKMSFSVIESFFSAIFWAILNKRYTKYRQ